MNDIRLLDAALINKIAAGEVVERPASVVKELAENALDAGASAITIETAGGGIDLIRVTDDGRGIPADQMRTAFLRHATSKLRDFDGLTNVLTMGFRGEALAAIAAVAEVEMVTKTADAEAGAYIRLLNGQAADERPIGAPDGTSVTVRDLFLNVPARRKFLKSAGTESGYISELVTRLMLGNPNIAIKYITNGAVAAQTTGAGLEAAALAVLGREAARLTVPADFERDGLRVSGIIGLPELSRANRRQMFFYVNGRYVRHRTAEAAVCDGYAGRLTVGRFPVFAMNLTIPPHMVDVNAHPAKTEVRFQNDRALYAAMRGAVLQALGGRAQIPVFGGREERAADFGVYTFKDPLGGAYAKPAEAPAGYAVEDDGLPAVTYIALDAPAPRADGLERIFTNYAVIGQAFGTYWLVESAGRLFAIDQHAAHERVLYEGLTKRLKDGGVQAQRLITPIAVPLENLSHAALADGLPLLERFGYEVEPLGEDALAVRAVPYVFNNPASGAFLRELLELLAEDGEAGSAYDLKADRIATMSCKAAVKANDRLSGAEARALIADLLKLDDPFHCPHGRPTIVEIAKGEFERMFRRT